MDDPASGTAIEALIRQEQALALSGFDEEVAYRIGSALRGDCGPRGD